MNEREKSRLVDTTGFPLLELSIKNIMQENGVPAWLYPVSPHGIIPFENVHSVYAIPLKISHGPFGMSKEAKQWLAHAKESAGIEKEKETVILMMFLYPMNLDEGDPRVSVAYQPVERDVLKLEPQQIINLDTAHYEVNTEFRSTQYLFAHAALTGVWPADGIYYAQALSLDDLFDMEEAGVIR